MEIEVGSKVRITDMDSFNEAFVNVGDLAEVVGINERELPLLTEYLLMSDGWEYKQYTSHYYDDPYYSFELVK